MAAKDQTDASLMTQTKGFIDGSMDELKKVSTPTKQETIQATLVTCFIILFVAGCIALIDLVFNNLMGAVLSGS